MHAISQHDPSRDGDSAPASRARAGERNMLLRALPDEEYARIIPHLEPIDLPVRHVLWKPNAPIHSVYFPRTCVCSLLVPLTDELSVESATVGMEGMVGVPVVLGVPATSSLAIVQVLGEALRVDADRLRRWTRDGLIPTLSTILLRYAQALLEQTAQSVACNRKHAMEERCARWLLMTSDRVGADQFVLTHEFLASMLGVRRASVTVAAGMLQEAGLIHYSRGKITIRDRERLEQASCECYRVVRERYEGTMGADGV